MNAYFSAIKKSQKIGLIVVKLVLLFLLIAAMSAQINQHGNLSELWTSYLQYRPPHANFLLLIVAFLAVGNWAAETQKWQLCLKPIAQLPYLQTLKGVLAGVSLAFFTPNRIGQYGGRLWLLPSEIPKTQAAFFLLQSNIAQLIANLGLGGIGFAVFGYQYKLFPMPYLIVILIAIFCYVATITAFYFNPSFFERKIPVAWRNKVIPYVNINCQPSNRYKYSILMLSFFRYFIYLTQFNLLLLAAGAKISVAQMLVLSLSSFFVQTVLPSLAVLELGIKGNVALYFFGQLSVNPIAILMATFFIWVVNWVIPAGIGTAIWLTKK